MPFPEREFYTLDQAARRWAATLEEVQHAIVAGKLHASAWVPSTFAYTITENSADSATRSPAQPLEGYVRLMPESCRIIFSRGAVERRKFQTNQPNIYLQIVESLNKIEFRGADLVILNDDLRQFEHEYHLVASKPCKVISVHKINAKSSARTQALFSYQNGFRFVRLDGLQFTFGEIQAAIIRQLYEASATDNPWVHGKTLLSNAGSNSMIMRDVFRHQPKWKELIHTNGRGFYRLSPMCSPIPAPPEPYLSHTQQEENV
jgi:hypothetical protein